MAVTREEKLVTRTGVTSMFPLSKCGSNSLLSVKIKEDFTDNSTLFRADPNEGSC